RLHSRVAQAIVKIDGRYIRNIKFRSFVLLNSHRITSFLVWIFKVVKFIFTLAAFYIYVPLVLSFFPGTANWTPKIYGYLINPLKTIAYVVVDYSPNLFFVVTISYVTYYLLKLVKFLFDEVENGTLHFEGFYKEWADPTYKLVRVLICIFAFMMAFPYLPGAGSRAFQGISVFLGILISLGSSSAIANIVSGVVITYMRPFKIGDYVTIGSTTGDIVEKTLLVTRVRTIKNEDITIPNSMVLNSHITNYSSVAEQQGVIIHTNVTIGYDVPWQQVHKLLINAAKKTSLIDLSKEPFVLQRALNDFTVSYEINMYTKNANLMVNISSELSQNIQTEFNDAHVEILSPHHTVLRSYGHGLQFKIDHTNIKS
ncbi:MAG: mechanosensitive ion channel family protein, partial [Pseudobdellovibrio sp.]